jgi:hypothetical protein
VLGMGLYTLGYAIAPLMRGILHVVYTNGVEHS